MKTIIESIMKSLFLLLCILFTRCDCEPSLILLIAADSPEICYEFNRSFYKDGPEYFYTIYKDIQQGITENKNTKYKTRQRLIYSNGFVEHLNGKIVTKCTAHSNLLHIESNIKDNAKNLCQEVRDAKKALFPNKPRKNSASKIALVGYKLQGAAILSMSSQCPDELENLASVIFIDVPFLGFNEVLENFKMDMPDPIEYIFRGRDRDSRLNDNEYFRNRLTAKRNKIAEEFINIKQDGYGSFVYRRFTDAFKKTSDYDTYHTCRSGKSPEILNWKDINQSNTNGFGTCYENSESQRHIIYPCSYVKSLFDHPTQIEQTLNNISSVFFIRRQEKLYDSNNTTLFGSEVTGRTNQNAIVDFTKSYYYKQNKFGMRDAYNNQKLYFCDSSKKPQASVNAFITNIITSLSKNIEKIPDALKKELNCYTSANESARYLQESKRHETIESAPVDRDLGNYTPFTEHKHTNLLDETKRDDNMRIVV